MLKLTKRNEISLAINNNNTNDKLTEDTSDKMLKGTKSQEDKGPERIQIADTVPISKEAFEAIE